MVELIIDANCRSDVSAQKKKLSTEQLLARISVLKLMNQGFSLKGDISKRDDLHDR